MFVDTPPTMWVVVGEAIRAATLVVIPARPGLFDLAAVRETVATARERDKPYAVVINAAPVKRDDKESPVVTQARTHLDSLGIPVWAGQISQRAGYALTLASGASATEAEPQSSAATRNRPAVDGDQPLGRCRQRGARKCGRLAGGGGASRQPRDGNPRRLESQRPDQFPRSRVAREIAARPSSPAAHPRSRHLEFELVAGCAEIDRRLVHMVAALARRSIGSCLSPSFEPVRLTGGRCRRSCQTCGRMILRKPAPDLIRIGAGFKRSCSPIIQSGTTDRRDVITLDEPRKETAGRRPGRSRRDPESSQ